ncbi:hypothetical protein HAX54_047800 [Datura stramonium]|uniref:Uncharacterized protein n=1 Tax=Datura stramonium TaxID=4076 RepID=A0ABS8RQ84_DATST|nr:hypothetical protein [Datura stramonium]
MEALASFQLLNLSALMIEHMVKIISTKDGRHGLGMAVLSIGCLNISVLLWGKSTILRLIKAQRRETEVIDQLTMLLTQREADLALLMEEQAVVGISGEPDAMLIRDPILYVEGQLSQLSITALQLVTDITVATTQWSDCCSYH